MPRRFTSVLSGSPDDPGGLPYGGPAGGQGGNPPFDPNDPNLPQNQDQGQSAGPADASHFKGYHPGDYANPLVLSPSAAGDFSGNWQQMGGKGGGGYTNWAAYLYANPLSKPTMPGATDPRETPGMANLDAGLNTSYFGQASQYPGGQYPNADPANKDAAPAGPAPSTQPRGTGAASSTFLATPGPTATAEPNDPNQRRPGFLGSLLQRSF